MTDSLVKGVLNRERRAIARAISLVERDTEQSGELMDAIHSHTGRSKRIGLTGPPGAGKSTLTAELARALRKNGASVAIIAVDPTSPFTDGAVLGDRVRMPEIEQDENVFIRSMATRGNSGGLSARTADAIDIFDAAGFDYIFVESVGVGQVELQIEKVVDTTIVVLVPESGDHVQAIKAGLMEIADIYVLNKSDRPGSSTVLQALYSALSFKGSHNRDWDIEIVPTIASEAEGIDVLLESLSRHREHLEIEQRLQSKRTARIKDRISSKVNELFTQSVWESERLDLLDSFEADVRDKKQSPQRCAEKILSHYIEHSKDKILKQT